MSSSEPQGGLLLPEPCPGGSPGAGCGWEHGQRRALAGRPVLVTFPSLADAWSCAGASRPDSVGALPRDAVINTGTVTFAPCFEPSD